MVDVDLDVDLDLDLDLDLQQDVIASRPVDEPVRLPAEGSYLLLSDLHLGNGLRTDVFGRKDALLLDLLDRTTGETDALILAGDVIDALQARDAAAARRAHPDVVARLEDLARRKPVWHLLGNHDHPAFVAALLPSARPCREVRLGEDARVVHGHQFDPHFFDGPLADADMRLAIRVHEAVERFTGHTIRLPFADHDNPTNRFAHWFFYRQTMALGLVAHAAARLGRTRRLRRWAAHHDYWARSQWGDNHAVLIPALAALAAGRERVLIMGHAHQAGRLERFEAAPSERVSGEPSVDWREPSRRAPDPAALRGKTYVNLGSWTFTDATCALWRAGTIELRDQATGRPVGNETYRFALTAPGIPGMREWWARYYRGLLRYDGAAVRRDLGFRS
jgi:UDP-2,3-diacylglucosamine pyrophosphatase LpxH